MMKAMIRTGRVGFRNVVACLTLSAFVAHAGSGCSMALVKGPPTGPQPVRPAPI